MQKHGAYIDRDYGYQGEREYVRPYSNSTRGDPFTYSSNTPAESQRFSKPYDNYFSQSDRTLTNEYDLPYDNGSWRSGSPIERRDPVLATRHSRKTTDHGRKRATMPSRTEEPSNAGNRRKKPKKPRDIVYIDMVTIPANASLEKRLGNTKGSVRINHLRIEDDAVVSSRNNPHKSSSRRRSKRKEIEKGTEPVSKLTRACELATLLGVVLQLKEMKSSKP